MHTKVLRIAIDARISNNPSGIGMMVINYVEHLMQIDLNNQYILIVNSNSRFNNIPKNFSLLETKYLLTDHPLGDYWFNITLPKTLENLNVDIFWGPIGFVPLTKTTFRKLATIHDMAPFDMADTFPFPTRKYFQFMFKRSILNADIIISVSDFTRSRILHHTASLKKTNIITIYNAASEQIKSKVDVDHAKILELNYDIKGPFLMFVGNLEPRKNLVTLIKAFQQIKCNGLGHLNNLKLVIVGQKGWLYDSIFAEIQRSPFCNDVILTGYVCDEDLHSLYCQTSAFIYPSLYEGFGIPPLEAMHCGSPVIVSDIPVAREVCQSAALYFDPHSVQELVEKIESVLTNDELAKKQSEIGKEQSRQFSWIKSTQKYLEVFHSQS